MKKIIFLLLITMSLFVFNSCDEDVENTKDLNYVTFETNPLKLVVNKNDSNNIDVSVYTTQISSSDRIIGIYVDLDQTTADAAAYTLPATVTIPANTNVGTFNITVTDTNLSEGGEVLVINFEMEEGVYTGGALTLKIALFCPLNIDDFLGSYLIDEAGYGVYPTTITKDPTIANRIWITNFWDWTNDLAYYDFNDDGTITMPSQQILMGNGGSYECIGTGTYNACNGTFHMVYTGDVAGTVHDFSPAL